MRIGLLIAKDFRCLCRARHVLFSTFGFGLLLIVTASFAFRRVGYGQEELQALTPGILWLSFLFSAVIGLNHSFLIEQEQDAATGILLSPVDAGTVFLAKSVVNFAFIGVLQLFILLSHAVLFGAELGAVFGQLWLVALLGGLGIAALGTLLSAIAVCTRGREIVLPLTLFPLLIPLVAASVFLMQEVIAEGLIPFGSFWFLLVVGFDVLALVLSWVLFEYVIRE